MTAPVRILVAGLIVAATVAIVDSGIHAYRAHRQCIDNGGHWEHINCHEVERQICITTDYGNNTLITTCSPTTSTECDSVCIGAHAEVTP